MDEESVVRKFRTTAADGKNYNTLHYNLDMIISLGYRVKSKIAINFRRWTTEAAHGHTAAEVIYERADASQPFI